MCAALLVAACCATAHQVVVFDGSVGFLHFRIEGAEAVGNFDAKFSTVEFAHMVATVVAIDGALCPV